MIRMLVMDCDGTMTDGRVYVGRRGEALKVFSMRDGHGIGMLRRAGIYTALITGEDSRITQMRAKKLRIDDLCMGVADKGVVLQMLLSRRCLFARQVAYIGDDLNDLSAMCIAGLSFAVADAAGAVKDAADVLLSRPGGRGAVREACDMILGGHYGPERQKA